jgi:branched-chain amino acid transport system ATP-binding protein
VKQPSESSKETRSPAPAVRADGVVLSVQRLHKSFGGVHAVRDVSFDVAQNQIVGLIGPNGSGKTTVLSLISGFARPDAGSITFHGQDLAGLRPHGVAALGLLRSWQDPRVIPHLTLRQNVDLGRMSSKRRAGDVGDSVPDLLLSDLGLLDRADEQAGDLPYGIQKLVALARTLSGRPKMLLLDEPMAGLWQSEAALVLREVERFSRHGPVLMVDHAFSAMREVCERIVVLNSGRKLMEGTPDEVGSDPAVLEVYLGHS